MTHKEILEKTKAELDRLVSEAKRKLDELATPKLEVGKWYKDTEGGSELLIHITDIGSNGIIGYGFGVFGGWKAPNTCFYSGNMENAYRFLVEATDQEVEEALERELVKRYGENWRTVKIKNHAFGSNINVNSGVFCPTISKFFIFNENGELFHRGKWAEVIKENRTTLDQDIKALKEKYPNLKFTITVEDNL